MDADQKHEEVKKEIDERNEMLAKKHEEMEREIEERRNARPIK